MLAFLNVISENTYKVMIGINEKRDQYASICFKNISGTYMIEPI